MGDVERSETSPTVERGATVTREQRDSERSEEHPDANGDQREP
jgi:hypothetical protein